MARSHSSPTPPALLGERVYDVTADAKRFLMTEDKPRPPLKLMG
jgi:hypothetical protein